MKFVGIGTGLAARAFCLLLTRSHDHDPRYQPLGLGAWIGNHHNQGLFLQLAHLANTGQCLPLVHDLEHAFGADWRKQVKQLRQQCGWYTIHDLAKRSTAVCRTIEPFDTAPKGGVHEITSGSLCKLL